MPKNRQQNSLQAFEAMRPYIGKEIDNLTNRSNSSSQYGVAFVAAHTHNNIDSLPVNFSDLGGVKAYSAFYTRTLSTTQVKALFTTPVVLIPNPGPRSFVFVSGVAGRLNYRGTAYTGTNNLEFRYTNGAGNKVAADFPSTIFLNATSNQYTYSPCIVDFDRNIDSNFTPVGGDVGNNGQIVVCTPNANPAAGNSPVTITIYYKIVSFTT